MSNTWVAAPRHPPMRCHRTYKARPEEGPFFEEDFLYTEYGGDRELRMYHAASWVREMCEAPGSPFVLRTREQAERDAGLLAALEEDRAAMQERIAALEAELDGRPPAPAPLDADALAAALHPRLVESLGNTFARKPGRKPREAA